MAIAHFALEPGSTPEHLTWRPDSLLFTPNRTLQGGAGLGAANAAMELVTGRPTIWATAQYLSFAHEPGEIDIHVTVEVAGHNTTQARCVLSRDGREILTAHSALGTRELEFEGSWCAPPDVPAPDDCEHFRFFEAGQGHMGDLTEFRLALGRQRDEMQRTGTRGDGSFALWVRCWKGRQPVSVADLAFIGDYMPLGFADAIGRPYAGNSLDNTIRVGKLVETEWVLLSIQVQQVVNGFGYGHAELWADDGTLLGTVSQSVVLRKLSKLNASRQPTTG